MLPTDPLRSVFFGIQLARPQILDNDILISKGRGVGRKMVESHQSSYPSSAYKTGLLRPKVNAYNSILQCAMAQRAFSQPRVYCRYKLDIGISIFQRLVSNLYFFRRYSGGLTEVSQCDALQHQRPRQRQISVELCPCAQRRLVVQRLLQLQPERPVPPR